ncbi:MAG: hypothetical protein NC091_07340 [Bacteroides sp.]|nr:hypothetical protein [Bacteroides sp.]
MENEQIVMKNHCNTLGKILRFIFWSYLILTLLVLLFYGIYALITPETSFYTEQYGSDTKVGFNIGDKGLILLVTDTGFHMGEYSCKVLFGLVWLIAVGYQILSAAILWCLKSIFQRINLDESPFTLFCSNHVRYIGFLLLCIFVYKNVIETAILFILGPSTARLSLISKLELALLGGIVLCLSYIFKYGIVLQQQSDETL